MTIEDSATRLRQATLILTAAFLSVFLLLSFANDVRLGSEGARSTLSFIGLWLVVAFLACSRKAESRIGNAAAGFGLVLFVGAIGAATSMVVLRWRFPQADPALFAIDATFGIDVRTITNAIAQHDRVTNHLWLFYSNSIPYLIYVLPILGLLGKRTLMWRTTFLYVGTLFSITLLSGLIPAKGAFLLLHPDVIARLPAGAGTYAFGTFDHYYSEQPVRLSFATLNGVATFPSFHTAAALTMAQVLWPIRLLRPTAAIWCAIVLFSTIPMGGHYAIDIVAGAAIFFLWAKLANLVADKPSFATLQKCRQLASRISFESIRLRTS